MYYIFKVSIIAVLFSGRAWRYVSEESKVFGLFKILILKSCTKTNSCTCSALTQNILSNFYLTALETKTNLPNFCFMLVSTTGVSLFILLNSGSEKVGEFSGLLSVHRNTLISPLFSDFKWISLGSFVSGS